MSASAAAVRPLARSELHPADILRVASFGLRSRRLRAALSALGISIGIAAMVAVMGLSESSRADLLASLDRLGTNLLEIEAGQGFGIGGDGTLPATAEPMLMRIGPVEGVSSVTAVDASLRRTDVVPESQTGGITVQATDSELLSTLRAELADGEWLDAQREQLPVVVLGAIAAERLGISDVGTGVRVWIGDEWFAVIGVLEPVELAESLDRAALIGEGIAAELFGTTPSPGTIYLRAHPDQIDAVRSVIAATANPENPDTVEISRPSDAIAAKDAASNAFTALFLGLGGVALLVGGVGIANVMVISVLERRTEIGLRRAIGATRRHIATQFLGEALLLAGLGGVGGVLLGAIVTAGYAVSRGWTVVIPTVSVVGGVVAALVIGAIAGLYPAVRASRLSPTDALRSM